MYTSRVQFTGLASGLDTDAIIKAMMTSHQAKIDREKNNKIILDWKKDIWAETNKVINKFQTDYVDKLRLESTFDAFKATSSSNSVTVTTTGNVAEGTHEITIEDLAKGVFVSEDLKLKSDADSKATLEELIGLQGDETFKINGKEITVTKDDTLRSLEKKINNADSSLNINFDTKNNKLFLSTKGTGENAKILIEGIGSNSALNSLGLSNMDEKGKNAKYTYNGVTLESETNNISVNGLNITLNDTTPIGESIKIQVSKDTEKVVEFVDEFVKAYNTLIEELNNKLYAEKVRLEPLTDAQKEKMTDKEIEEYEKNIKNSLLARDPSLNQLVGSMRSQLQRVVKDNPFGTLSAIGITTGPYSEKGKLTLDKDKLKKALDENSEAVKELFTSKGKVGANGEAIKGTQGIGTTLDLSFKELEKSIKDMKSYDSFYNDKVLEDKVKESRERILELEERYRRAESIYYKKFTAMEKAMSMINSQGNSIGNWLQ